MFVIHRRDLLNEQSSIGGTTGNTVSANSLIVQGSNRLATVITVIIHAASRRVFTR